MNGALLYLWLALLRRRSILFLRDLRRPTTLIGFAAVVTLFAGLFYYRDTEVFERIVRKQSLIGLALLMLAGSIFTGFQRRGLVFDLPDIEFLFTSPFTQRQVLFYRLLPEYLFAAIQALVFYGLLSPRLDHPILGAVSVAFFQILCFHVSAGTALLASRLSVVTHYRIRWVMLSFCCLLAAFYLRLAWDFRLVPSFIASPMAQLLFYPAVTLSDSMASPLVQRWITGALSGEGSVALIAWREWVLLAGLGFGALATFWLVMSLKVDLFESSLNLSAITAEERLRTRQGRQASETTRILPQSARLPNMSLFGGAGAIVWKNLLVARRCRREMVMAGLFTLLYAGFFAALLIIYRHLSDKAGGARLYDARGFTTGIALVMAGLGFFLQRMFPFDFRRDGPHLLEFRTLPISPLALTLAEVLVPTAFCLASQAIGLIPLVIYGYFDLPTVILVLLGYPAVALALNSVWNFYYLFSAARRASDPGARPTPVGATLIVALSFLVFFPAGWVTVRVANHFVEGYRWAVAAAAASGLVVQFCVDGLILMALVTVLQRFEISHDRT